jgi:hypothetical protein
MVTIMRRLKKNVRSDWFLSEEDFVHLGNAYQSIPEVRTIHYWALLELPSHFPSKRFKNKDVSTNSFSPFYKLDLTSFRHATKAFPPRYRERLAAFVASGHFEFDSLNFRISKVRLFWFEGDAFNYPELYFSSFAESCVQKHQNIFSLVMTSRLKDGASFNNLLCKRLEEETLFAKLYQTEWFRAEVLAFLAPNIFLLQSVWEMHRYGPISLEGTDREFAELKLYEDVVAQWRFGVHRLP